MEITIALLSNVAWNLLDHFHDIAVFQDPCEPTYSKFQDIIFLLEYFFKLECDLIDVCLYFCVQKKVEMLNSSFSF